MQRTIKSKFIYKRKFNLKHFAIKLSKNNVDLDPMYSKIIDDYFWELTSNFQICSTKI